LAQVISEARPTRVLPSMRMRHLVVLSAGLFAAAAGQVQDVKKDELGHQHMKESGAGATTYDQFLVAYRGTRSRHTTQTGAVSDMGGGSNEQPLDAEKLVDAGSKSDQEPTWLMANSATEVGLPALAFVSLAAVLGIRLRRGASEEDGSVRQLALELPSLGSASSAPLTAEEKVKYEDFIKNGKGITKNEELIRLAGGTLLGIYVATSIASRSLTAPFLFINTFFSLGFLLSGVRSE